MELSVLKLGWSWENQNDWSTSVGGKLNKHWVLFFTWVGLSIQRFTQLRRRYPQWKHYVGSLSRNIHLKHAFWQLSQKQCKNMAGNMHGPLFSSFRSWVWPSLEESNEIEMDEKQAKHHSGGESVHRDRICIDPSPCQGMALTPDKLVYTLYPKHTQCFPTFSDP